MIPITIPRRTQSIIVFRTCFYIPSETFIRMQVNYLKFFFNVFLVAESFLDNDQDFKNLNKIVLNGYEKKVRQLTSKFLKRNVDQQFQFHNPTQLKRLIKEQNIKLIHAHFGFEAMKLLPTAQEIGVPLVVTFHGMDASKLLANEWYKVKLPQLFDYASKIIVVSGHMVESLELSRWRDKVLLLPCSVDCEFFKPFDRGQNENLILLHSGRLVKKKGVPDLIRVFAKLHKKYKNLQLNIIGDGPEMDFCRKEANESGVSNAINFLGKQPHAAIKKALNEADIFILNSRVAEDGDMEGTPVSILEAMSMQKAVISTYHAGIPDIIQDNQNGKLVPEKNNELLEKAIREMIENREERIQMGVEARKLVMSRFSHKQTLPVLRDTLMEVLNKVNRTVES